MIDNKAIAKELEKAIKLIEAGRELRRKVGEYAEDAISSEWSKLCAEYDGAVSDK